jgi:hypothetical protein
MYTCSAQCEVFLAWIKLISNMFPSHVICLQVGFTACVICILYRQAYTLGLYKLLPCSPFPNVLAAQLPGDHLRFRAWSDMCASAFSSLGNCKYSFTHSMELRLWEANSCSHDNEVPAFYATLRFMTVSWQRGTERYSIPVVFNLFCSRTPRYNFSSTLYPQSCWYIMQVIHIV